jgi:AcrR family transcriptional regulator
MPSDPDRSRGRPAKRDAIVAAAQEVFLREGYTRTSMDVVSEAAGVSKRTVYNHFPDKRTLFLAVIEDTVAPVLDAFIRMVDRHLTTVDEEGLRATLIDFGRDWVRTSVLFPEAAGARTAEPSSS